MNRSLGRLRFWSIALGFGIAGLMTILPAQAQQLCGGVEYPFPYTDVSGVGAAFCPGIMEAYVTGVSKGTTATTFSPNNDVTRVQMTTFLQRSLDQGLTRASRRAALNQWSVPQNTSSMQSLSAASPFLCAADGENIWVANSNNVIQLQANSGATVATWSLGAPPQFSYGVLVAAGKVFTTNRNSPGSLYVIDPTGPPPAAAAETNLGNDPTAIAFDGTNLWTANSGGSVSIITPAGTPPWPPANVTTVTTGFTNPIGILFDGSHIWVSDSGSAKLFQLDAAGAILQTISVGGLPLFPAFDGANIWLPNFSANSVTVVQASTGSVVATIVTDGSNQLDGPTAASFDGERVIVTNQNNKSVTLFKAADLSFIANVGLGATTPYGACSDGVNFWLTSPNEFAVLRF
jgi:hypothetical protein